MMNPFRALLQYRRKKRAKRKAKELKEALARLEALKKKKSQLQSDHLHRLGGIISDDSNQN